MKHPLSLFFVCLVTLSFAQDKIYVATKLDSVVLPVEKFLGQDSFGFYYSINNNVLSKSKKEESFEYKNMALGIPSQIDIQNPLKTVLFYENFNTILLLDNQWNEIQKIDFSEIETPMLVAAMGIASQNRLWIYDSISQQIGLFDYQKNTFDPIAPSFKESITSYITDFNTFRWMDDQLNWYACDSFGAITLLGKVADFDQIQCVSNEVVVFSKNKKIYIQTFTTNTIFPIENTSKSFENFYYKNQNLSIFTNQYIINYKIIIP